MSVAGHIRDHVESVPRGTFIRPSDFEGSRGAIDTALSRLNETRADLVHVGWGIYWKGVSSRYGPGNPDPVAVARAVLGPGVGPSEWSASHVLGLSTQVPATPVLAAINTTERDLGVDFVKRSNPARFSLEFEEIALLEALRAYPAFVEVEWPELVDRVATAETSGEIDINRVWNASRSEHSRPLRENLGRLRSDLNARHAGASL